MCQRDVRTQLCCKAICCEFALYFTCELDVLVFRTIISLSFHSCFSSHGRTNRHVRNVGQLTAFVDKARNLKNVVRYFACISLNIFDVDRRLKQR